MANDATTYLDPLTSAGSTVGEKLSNTAAQVKDKVSELGHAAKDKIDENRGAAASGLEKAATTLHEKAGSIPGGETVTNLAHGAAEKLSSTAEYVRTHDVNRMMSDVETLVKNNPGPSILVAAVIGFLVGRAFTSSD
ncbi:MAG TPA: hypothetical protein VIX89_01675 [Bryobacteraceae bacterium]